MLDLHIISDGRGRGRPRSSRVVLQIKNVSNGCVSSAAPFFCDYLLKYLLDVPALGKTAEERRHAVYGGGLTIQTTLDLRFQRLPADRSMRTPRQADGRCRWRVGHGRARHRLRPGARPVPTDGHRKN